MKWISVEESLPKDAELVLAYGGIGLQRVNLYRADGSDLPMEYPGQFYCWYEPAEDFVAVDLPTHWMPLPEPPEE